MSIKDHPKFDDSGNYTMSENHLMVFLHTDGFTERLLGVDVFITTSFEIEVYLRCFKKGNRYGDFRTEFALNEVPVQILTFLALISKADVVDFGYENKDQNFMEDAGKQCFLFNHKNKTTGFYVSGGMSVRSDDFKTELGQKFFTLQKFMNDWMEELYNNFQKTIS